MTDDDFDLLDLPLQPARYSNRLSRDQIREIQQNTSVREPSPDWAGEIEAMEADLIQEPPNAASGSRRSARVIANQEQAAEAGKSAAPAPPPQKKGSEEAEEGKGSRS